MLVAAAAVQSTEVTEEPSDPSYHPTMSDALRYEPRVLVRRVERRKPTPLTLLAHGLASVVLVPSYALAAAAIGTPGMWFHLEAVGVALRLVTHGGTGLIAQAGRLALYPMDSTRYFEFDWVWSRLQRLERVRRYLDVSSPRFLPLSYVRHSGVEQACFVNPDHADLATTERWAAALSLTDRCHFSDALIESASFEEGHFDAITSISVFEHIADERLALTRLERLLAPGGTLLLTLPCTAVGYDQFRDYDEYNLTRPDSEGRYFFQRFYDASLLQDRVFSVLGEPRQMTVYGECEPGYFGRNAQQKMRGLPYPFWREGYMMGRHFRIYPSIDELPGEGVVALEFVKAARL
jgi:SAM-dependent methyltransferase